MEGDDEGGNCVGPWQLGMLYIVVSWTHENGTDKGIAVGENSTAAKTSSPKAM
jgi:hypothetical protein